MESMGVAEVVIVAVPDRHPCYLCMGGPGPHGSLGCELALSGGGGGGICFLSRKQASPS